MIYPVDSAVYLVKDLGVLVYKHGLSYALTCLLGQNKQGTFQLHSFVYFLKGIRLDAKFLERTSSPPLSPLKNEVSSSLCLINLFRE